MTLGERIQALRKDAGLSQEELGEKLGVARQSVSKWESDTTIPELDKLIAMSRLFGVTVGALLGMEESEGSNHELTDRELAALEEIAQKLTPVHETVEKPKKKRRWPKVLAVVAACWAVLVLVGRINSLENQLGNLQYNVSNIQNTVSREIGSISSQVRDILEEQNSVTAGKSYEIVDMDLLDNTVTFFLTATPREYREGMTAEFTAQYRSGRHGSLTIPGVLAVGQTFTAELTCPLTDDITLSVGFESEGTIVTQQLGQENYLLSDSKLSIDGNLNWTISGTTITSLEGVAYLAGSGRYKTAEGWQFLTPVKWALRLWKNGELITSQESELTEPDRSSFGAIKATLIGPEGLIVRDGDQIILSFRYTDNAGREDEVFLDGVVVNEEGSPDRLAPYDKDWEGNYPWE